MNNPIRIITHSGSFHTDEIMAIAALDLYLKGAPYEVVRTRDMEVIATGDYVVDVGGVYDHEARRYDHHQQGGAGQRENGIPYSSFGLVWKHYGEAIAGSKEVAEIIDRRLGHPIDLGDNGIETYTPTRTDTEPLTLHYMTAMFRPSWRSTDHTDARFMELLPIFRRFLELVISDEQDNQEGRRIVEEIYQEAEDKRVLVVEGRHPWVEVLASHPEPLYAVYEKRDNDTWGVKCVRNRMEGFENRKGLPLAWAGLTGEALAAVSGVPDALFCHNKRFIAGAKSKEGALKLAQIALNT